jgi:hypothetical protein
MLELSSITILDGSRGYEINVENNIANENVDYTVRLI